MNGGGDTPSPTLENFRIKQVSSDYYLVNKDGDFVRFNYDDGYKVMFTESSDASAFGLDNATGKTPNVTATVEEDPETYNLTISLDGYNSLTMVYDESTDQYSPTPYVPSLM